jgi:hypothetical protein
MTTMGQPATATAATTTTTPAPAAAVAVQLGDYQLAVEALQLVEPYSDDDVNAAADEYEELHGIPLIRPHEADVDGRPTPAFAKRISRFKIGGKDNGLVADPEVFRKELRVLFDLARKKGWSGLSQQERDAFHENQRALGLPLTDFNSDQRSPKAIVEEAQRTFKHVQKHSTTYIDRMSALVGIEDLTTLQLFVEHDKSEDVREAAVKRIEQLRLQYIPETEQA